MHLEELAAEYAALKAKNLTLDLTRGKPSPAQLDLSNALLGLPGESAYSDASGTDLRNYGGLEGLRELREIFGQLLKVPTDQLLAVSNASLTIMHDVVVNALLHGVPGGERPWRFDEISFLCPVPGYDRHFTICEAFGIRMIPVPFADDRLDLAEIARLAASDPSIRGIWCVPMYSNPTGVTYTEAETRALMSMPTAASDFRIMWDNAYAVHHLTDAEPEVLDVLSIAAEEGNPNRPLVFASTSKITYPGAGIAFFGGSAENVTWYKKHLFAQTIGPDKINHLRHVELLMSADGVRAHMRKHREIVQPRFDAVLELLERRLTGHATWTVPQGGYFISLDVPNGCATRAITLAKEIGIAVTPAGSTWPYGEDPHDSNIRIAPTFPSVEDLTAAIDGLCTCVLLAEAEQTLSA